MEVPSVDGAAAADPAAAAAEAEAPVPVEAPTAAAAPTEGGPSAEGGPTEAPSAPVVPKAATASAIEQPKPPEDEAAADEAASNETQAADAESLDAAGLSVEAAGAADGEGEDGGAITRSSKRQRLNRGDSLGSPPKGRGKASTPSKRLRSGESKADAQDPKDDVH